MKAIILAGGKGSRLFPLTLYVPKCLLNVGGQPLISYQLNNLRKAGVTKVVFVVGFLSSVLVEYLMNEHEDLEIEIIDNEQYENTSAAYGLWLAREHLDNQVLYLNADVLCHPEIVKQIVASKFESVTAIRTSTWEDEEVNVIHDSATNQITEMGKHISEDQSHGEFIGVTKIGKNFAKELSEVLQNFVDQGELKKFAADGLNQTVQRGHPMYSLIIDKYPAIEIDTSIDLKEAELILENITNMSQ